MGFRTRSGKLVEPLALRAQDVCIEDIAQGLSHINRFLGQTVFPYSVAQHSVAVMRRLSPMAGMEVPAGWRLRALLHDAAEAYLGDVVRPVKRDLWFAPGHFSAARDFGQVEIEVRARIFEALGLPPVEREAEMWMWINKADDIELAREMAWLFRPEHWAGAAELRVAYAEVHPMQPWAAKGQFLEHFFNLLHLARQEAEGLPAGIERRGGQDAAQNPPEADQARSAERDARTNTDRHGHGPEDVQAGAGVKQVEAMGWARS